MVKNKGFTLMEVMIVVTVVAIIAAIAYPSYAEHIRKANRTEAKAELLDVAKKLQRYKVARFSFQRPDNSFITLADIGEAVPLTIPRQGTALYTITLTDVTANGWTLNAIPINNTTQQLDGGLAMNHRGEKCWSQLTPNCVPDAATNWDGR